jgi:hypothetical protein
MCRGIRRGKAESRRPLTVMRLTQHQEPVLAGTSNRGSRWTYGASNGALEPRRSRQSRHRGSAPSKYSVYL